MMVALLGLILILSTSSSYHSFSLSVRGKGVRLSGIRPLRAVAEYAVLFDCDGVIVETEELHRLAYNKGEILL